MVKPPFVRSPYNYDMDAASLESGTRCDDPHLAQQQFLEESDINTIVERFGLNGEMPVSPVVPSYGDFSEVTDFQSAMNAVVAAQAGFMELPAKVRARFSNDPQQLLEFLANGENRKEAIALGLIPEPVAPEVPVASPEASKAP